MIGVIGVIGVIGDLTAVDAEHANQQWTAIIRQTQRSNPSPRATSEFEHDILGTEAAADQVELEIRFQVSLPLPDFNRADLLDGQVTGDERNQTIKRSTLCSMLLYALRRTVHQLRNDGGRLIGFGTRRQPSLGGCSQKVCELFTVSG